MNAPAIDLKTRLANDLGFHPATEVSRPKHEAIRKLTRELGEQYIDLCPHSRELSLALTALQEAQMWANAAIAVNLAPLE